MNFTPLFYEIISKSSGENHIIVLNENQLMHQRRKPKWQQQTEQNMQRNSRIIVAITAALADETNIPKDQLKMISTGFCDGIGALEGTCGALIGVGMIASLKTEGSKLAYTPSRQQMSSRKTQARSDAENSKELTQERFSVPATTAFEMRFTRMKQLCSCFQDDRTLISVLFYNRDS